VNRTRRNILILMTAIAIGAALVWSFTRGRKELALDQTRELPVTAPSRVSVQHDERIVALDPETQAKIGLVTAPLEPTSQRRTIKAYGTVLELQPLLELRTRYAAADADRAKAQAALDASHRAYLRMKTLNEIDRNMSDKALQAAEAAWRADDASAGASAAAEQAVEASARQQWGEVLTRWLKETPPEFDRLLTRRDLLVQITLPSDAPIVAPPNTAAIQTAEESIVPAALVSAAPTTDPRIQGVSFFYRVAARANGLISGINVVAYLPVGAVLRGVTAPATAVVWWQGTAWVYIQQGPDHFVRRAIPTDTPAGPPDSSGETGGWFVTHALAPGERIIVNGAQVLLSEEFRSQIQGGD
jgi:hypothetical protein